MVEGGMMEEGQEEKGKVEKRDRHVEGNADLQREG